MPDSKSSGKFFTNPDYTDFWTARVREEKYEEVYWKRFIENLKTASGDLILEVGVGEGRNASQLLTNGATYVGLDISRTMLNKARERMRDANFENVDLVVGDAMSLPFKPGSFDKSISLATLFFVPDQKIAIRELLSVSRTRVGIEFRNSLNPRIFLYARLVFVVNLARPMLVGILSTRPSRKALSLIMGVNRTDRLAKQLIVYGSLQPVYGLRASEIRQEIEDGNWKIESLEGFPMMTMHENEANFNAQRSSRGAFDPVLIAYASAE